MILETKKIFRTFKIIFLAVFFYVIKMSLTVLFSIIEFYIQGNEGPMNFINVTATPEIWAMVVTIIVTMIFMELHLTANPFRIHFDNETLYIRTAFRTLGYELSHCGCFEKKFLFSTYYSIEVPGRRNKKRFDISNLSYKDYHLFFDCLNKSVAYNKI